MESAQKNAHGASGLTNDEVQASRARYGSNALTQKKRKSFLLKYLEGFADPIIRILLIALGINIVFVFHSLSWYEPVGIAVAIIVATFVSAASEYGNEAAFEKLQQSASQINCRVLRAQGVVEIPIADIVRGDLVLLQSGDRVPADGTLIEGELRVDQSALNGETKEAYKTSSAIGVGYLPTDFLSPGRVFRATVVCAGEGLMQVSAVGDKTFYGRLAQEVQEDTRESPMKVRLGELAGSISKLGYLGAIAVVIAYLFNTLLIKNGFSLSLMLGQLSNPRFLAAEVLHAVTLAVTVIVVAVPEGLPMMITVVLSANMKRMLKDNVLVRKLVGIETAGSLNILFSDKTGTLTRGSLRVCSLVDGGNRLYDDTAKLTAKPLWSLFHAAMYYNNAASMTVESGECRAVGSNATDRAFLEFAHARPFKLERVTKQGVTPFSSKQKFSATSVRGDINLTLYKGAPEIILKNCTHYYDDSSKKQPLNTLAALYRRLHEQAGRSIRVLALAAGEATAQGELPNDLTLIGLVGIRDEVRPEAVTGVHKAQRAGVQVVMITGDALETATAIARETGILKYSHELVLTSEELGRMTDSELKQKLRELRVVARALPSDKSRLVRAAQELNLVVGMTGDGVNDAPALKKADVGFAMGSGTEVAKEASDIVILDDNINSIAHAILYGRTIFKSIRKFIIFQLTINLCAVGVSILGPFLGIESPVTVLQMLWINMVMDTLAGLAFSGEPPLSEYMCEMPKRRNEPILNRYMLGEILFTGLYSTVLCLVFLKLPAIRALFRPAVDDRFLMTGFFGMFIFSAIFNSFNARTHRFNLLAHIERNRIFLGVMSIVGIIQLGLIFLGGSLFRTAGLTLGELAIAVAIAFSVIPVDYLRKIYLSRFSERKGV